MNLDDLKYEFDPVMIPIVIISILLVLVLGLMWSAW